MTWDPKINNSAAKNVITTPLPVLKREESGLIDGRPATEASIKLHLPEEDNVRLGWIALSYSVSKTMLINQMVAWAWYCGRADTEVMKLMRHTAAGRVPEPLAVLGGKTFPGDSANRMAALYHRCLTSESSTYRDKDRSPYRFREEFLYRLHTQYHGTGWSPMSLTVTAVFRRWQRMFADLSRWQPDPCDGSSEYAVRQREQYKTNAAREAAELLEEGE